MTGFKNLKDYVLESNSAHILRPPTDEQIIDAIVEAFGLTRPEAIERLASINFAAAREAA